MQLQPTINEKRRESGQWVSGLSRKIWLYPNQIMDNYREFLIPEMWGKGNDLQNQMVGIKILNLYFSSEMWPLKFFSLQWQKFGSARQHLAVCWIGKNSICDYVTHTNLTFIPLCHYITPFTPLEASPCFKMVSPYITKTD